MSAPALKGYRVKLHRRGGRYRGHIDVQASSDTHAERVAVKQVIEVSFPKSKPAQWVVDGVEVRTC